MLSFRCARVGCDFAIEDGEHVDDVLDTLHTHYRAQHANVFFRRAYAGEEIERYNQTLEDFLISQFGPQWDEQGAARITRHIQNSLLRANNVRYYSQALRDEAQAYVDDNADGAAADPNAVADPNAIAGAVDAVGDGNPFGGLVGGGNVMWNPPMQDF